MISNYYTETVVVLSQTTSTGWGAEPTWSGTTVKAAMNPVTGNESFVGGRETAFASWKMFCASTVTVDNNDRVSHSGSTYDVLFVKNTLQKGHHKVVLLRDVAR